MKKAEKLIEILTENHTRVLPEKYAKIILQVATLEERIRMFMSFGMVDRSKEFNDSLVELIKAIRREYDQDQDI